jgi:hypothetical protein
MERIRSENPDAAYAAWPEVPKALAALLKHPPSVPAIAPPRDFSTTPLLKKLGIGEDMQVALIAAPDGFEELLGDIPEGTTLLTHITPKTNLALSFIRSLEDLAAMLDLLTIRLPKRASVWIAHPKRRPKHRVDFNQNHVRDAALASGLVDYKVCSIDGDWSALKFAHRRRQTSLRSPSWHKTLTPARLINYRSRRSNSNPISGFPAGNGAIPEPTTADKPPTHSHLLPFKA